MRKLEGQQWCKLQKLLGKSVSISQSEHQLFVTQVKTTSIESKNVWFFGKLDDLVSNCEVSMGLKTGW